MKHKKRNPRISKIEKAVPINFKHISSLEDCLKRRIQHHRFIMPELVLLQLHFGTIDHTDLIGFILKFDPESIREALRELDARGLR